MSSVFNSNWYYSINSDLYDLDGDGDGDFTGEIKFRYLLFANDEYDGEHRESFCDGGGGDAGIWFVLCSAFSAPLHPKKVETVLWYFKHLLAKIDNNNDFKNNKL